MFIKLGVILLLMQLNCVRNERLDWELAVVVENEISLFHRNGTLVESKTQPFSSLKALAYDNVRDQFIVSDMDMINDTIYTVKLNKETDTTEPIIKGLPGDVQGLAIDPIDDILYWSDAINHTINYVSLKERPLESKEFLIFDEAVPHALAIDACNRYLYFTNPGEKPSIERIKLDKTGREIIVDNLIMSPVGLAIDYKAQKLYWADSRIGTVAGRIESSKLDGTNRKIVVEKNTMEPFGLAVDEEAIYWTDTNNNGLYMFMKTQESDDKPVKLLGFAHKPMGLVANNNIIKETSDCKSLEAAIKEYKEPTTKENLTPEKETQTIKECLNGGELTGNYCLCKRGFTGSRCESSICNSFFCLNGDCFLSSAGKPLCHCERGFLGERCQRNICEQFCLNGGECNLNSTTRNELKCTCPEGYAGDRCEYKIRLCDSYCQNRENKPFFGLMCRCSERFNSNFDEQNRNAALFVSSSESDGFISIVKDPFVHLALILICIVVIISLIVYIRTSHKKRPRIKKRIIVNKNVTPLTYRPQPTTEQCEITIENCCNMNVCETPCFEPKEDKKKLLHNMEGDELY